MKLIYLVCIITAGRFYHESTPIRYMLCKVRILQDLRCHRWVYWCNCSKKRGQTNFWNSEVFFLNAFGCGLPLSHHAHICVCVHFCFIKCSLLFTLFLYKIFSCLVRRCWWKNFHCYLQFYTLVETNSNLYLKTQLYMLSLICNLVSIIKTDIRSSLRSPAVDEPD